MNLKFVSERKKVPESSRVCGDSAYLHVHVGVFLYCPRLRLCLRARTCVLAQVMDVLGEQVNLLLM